MLEEAHNIVGRNLGVSSAEEGNTKQEAANYITRMLAEMRALREGIIIADQLPTAVAAEVVKNTNVKIAHRLVSSDDRKDIGQAMLLDQSQIEEIARLSPGESFLYMEGWYRPRAVKIPEKLNAKVKLGIERSITNSDIIKHIKKQSWYCDGIATVLDTAVTEHKRLCDDYRNNVIDRLRTHVKNLSLSYTELEVLFTDLTREIFDRLVGELHFTFKRSPEDVRSALREIDPRNPRSFRNLHPANHLSLRELLDLRSHLLAHLATFVQQHQEVMTAYSRLIGDRHRQEWQQVTRLSEAIRHRVATLADFLGKPELATTLQEEFAILQVDERKLIEREYATLGDRLKKLKESQKDWEAKLKEVLTLAIEQAKVNKVNQDMKLGGQ